MVNKDSTERTSPLGEEGVDVSQCLKNLERLMKARLVAVDRDHHRSLERLVRQAAIPSLKCSVVTILIERRFKRILDTNVLK